MPIPSPNRFKDKDSFIEACMSVEIGSGKDRDQAFAICNSVWERKGLTLKTKIKVYQAMVLTALLYASKTWTVYARHEKISV